MEGARSLPGTRRHQARSQDPRGPRSAGELTGRRAAVIRAPTSFPGFPGEAAHTGGAPSPCLWAPTLSTIIWVSLPEREPPHDV